MAYSGFRDLKVYQLSYALAMEIFETTKSFPPVEKFSLTDQIRRSSRSVVSNIAEAWSRRRYMKSFVSKLIESHGEEAETEVWLDMSCDCGYLQESERRHFREKYDEVGRMLHGMIMNADRFCR